jgi:hypothetical protein
MAASMKKSTRALLLSLLLLPGAGHFVLQRAGRGGLLVATALLAAGVVVRDAMQQAYAIVDKIQSGEIPLDPAALERALGQTDSTAATLAWSGFIVVWVVAAIDVYRIGRQLDARAAAANPVAE